jgi:hemoglobin
MAEPTLYDRVGGVAFFELLVDHFYEGVAGDRVLRRLYPDLANLAPARRRLALFLVQYWGGPTTYLQERGHPRLRARHSPYVIGTLERDRWLLHMRAAIDACGAGAAERQELHAYMTLAADAMTNVETSADPAQGAGL